MEIRHLAPGDDLNEISSIYENSWKYAYKGIIPQEFLDSIPEGRWAGKLNAEGRDNLVLIADGKLAGTACICSSRWDDHPGCGEIVSIYLLPEYMGKGLGGDLLERCTEELKKKGFRRVILWVLEENTRARHFYEKHGFVCAGEYLNDCIGGKDLREVLYRLEIKGE